jgi:hypothetical protein
MSRAEVENRLKQLMGEELLEVEAKDLVVNPQDVPPDLPEKQ